MSSPWDDDNYMGGDDINVINSSDQNNKPLQTVDKKENKLPLQVIPKQLKSRDLITVHEKVTNAIFGSTEEDDPQKDAPWGDVVSGKTSLTVIEKEPRTVYDTAGKPKTINKSLATVTIQLGIREAVDECIRHAILTEKLGEFDRIVLEACLTHQYHGQLGIAISTIFKYMGYGGEVPPTIRRDIWNSIDKMRHIDVIIDATEAYEKLERLHNTDGTPKRKPIKNDKKSNWIDDIESNNKTTRRKQNKFILKGYLLPATDIDICCNGLTFEGIKFLDVSPVFSYAKDKGETGIISQHLLQAAKQRATKNFIALKHYILCRIRSIRRNSTLTPAITFDSLYKNCGDPERAKSDSKFRTRIREATLEYLKTLKTEKEIKSYDCVDRNNQKHSDISKGVKILVTFPATKK